MATITLKDKWSVDVIKDKFSKLYVHKGIDEALKYLWELSISKKITLGVFKEIVKLIQAS